jgi:hypothetical protein
MFGFSSDDQNEDKNVDKKTIKNLAVPKTLWKIVALLIRLCLGSAI